MPDEIVHDASPTVAVAEAPAAAEQARPDDQRQPGNDLVLEELLVEDVSIDGMCGVY